MEVDGSRFLPPMKKTPNNLRTFEPQPYPKMILPNCTLQVSHKSANRKIL
jgi:hypothetical protein